MKNKKLFGINQCSLCERFDLTIGQQKYGGIRYCEECFKKTFTYFKFNEEAKEGCALTFQTLRQESKIQKQIARFNDWTQEERKHYAIGESKRRVFESEINQ